MGDRRRTDRQIARPSVWAVLAFLACVALAGILVTAGLDVEEIPADGVPPVEENMDVAEVTQPVTAVLLNFRGYDTWMEVGVLIVAVFGVLALHRAHGLSVPEEERTDQVLDTITRLLVPFMVLVGVFLLWAGTRIPGGAFQGGVILGAAGVLLRVAGVGSGIGRLMTGRPLRFTAPFGFALFLLVGGATLLAGRYLLDYPAGWGGPLILLLETGVMISVGWTLAFLYMAATPPPPDTAGGDDR